MTGTVIYNEKTGFEQDYISLREKEGRLYSDAEVLQLPAISSAHIHYNEWQIRKESAQRLCNYFQKKLSLLKILEVGCGNGWLAHQLSCIPGCDVTGTDINFAELQQAARVFSHVPNLSFCFGGIDAREVQYDKYDVIVFASSIQYFPSLVTVLEKAGEKLKSNGEIHILDSPFYHGPEVESAMKRTEDHFHAIGFPGMTPHYYHHTWEELQDFTYRKLYEPSLFNRLFKNYKNPFPWISIAKGH